MAVKKKSEARIAKERKRKADKKRKQLLKQIAVGVLVAALALMMIFALAATPKAM